MTRAINSQRPENRNSRLAARICFNEQYHLFRRGGEICRYGIYSLTRDYYRDDQPLPEPNSDIEISMKIPQPRLRVMQVVITAKCNLQCNYCSFLANSPKLPALEMSKAEIEYLCRRFNREIGENGLLLITGGEPELYPDAVNYLIENIAGKIILFTNGTLIDYQRLKYFQRHNVGILFSLDGDIVAHDSVRRGKDGSFRKVFDALKIAGDLGFDFGISTVVGDHNIARLPELVEYIHYTFKPASLGLNLPHKSAGAPWLRIEEYTEAMLKVFTFAKSAGLFIDQINRRLEPLLNRKFRFRDCSAQGEKMVVWPGGISTSCVNQAALNNRRIDWANRIPILNENCRDCYAIGICGGGCVFDGEAIFGKNKFDQRNCYFTRKMLEFIIWDIRDELNDEADNQEALHRKYGRLLQREGKTNFSVGHETI
ncbi:MAG: radical SAM protein [candidate division Zixibacteria bacterium]|nr:radical SAM protein [Candidatus Tariuqbacter arcticus]